MELNNTEMKMEAPIDKLLESLGVTAEQWEEPDVMGF